MRKRWITVIAVLIGLGVASRSHAAEPKASKYHVHHRYVLGGEGFWDYLRFDPDSRRLYISHSTRVVVMNAADGSVAGEIPNTAGVHGIALAPEFGRGFTSNGRDSSVTIFSLDSLKVIGTVQVTGANPDAILYDPASHRVFTFNGRGKNATVIDAASGKVAGTIPLGGKPEFAASDEKGRIYVNIEDTSELVAIDPRSMSVLARWPLAPGKEPSGLALDREHNRLFAVCDNELMVVVDAGTGKVVTTLPIGKGVDGAGFDPGNGNAYSSNGEGTLTVVHEDDPDHFRVVATVPTQRGARTMALDPKTHDVFLATAQLGPAPAPTKEMPHPRPTIVSGTFTILVVGK